MSKPNQDPKKALVRRPPSTGYEVGYAKPPEHTRFQPGRSGNPAGRRKGTKNKPKLPALNEERLKSVILEEAYRTVTIADAKGQVTIPMAQAIVRSIAVSAAKGNSRAQRLFASILSRTERENRQLHDEWLDVAMTYKIEWERELERRKVLGITGPDPLPHPDHVVIDMGTGQVRIKGPMTKEEKVQWDEWRARKAECDRSIDELEQMLTAEPNAKSRALIMADIAHEKRIREIICRAVPD